MVLTNDLAILYKTETKRINEDVSRNSLRFPERFMFQLNNEEYMSLRFQIETLKIGRGQHKKYLPYAFTEQGVAMLAAVLRTEVAEKISIKIMDAFVIMCKYISSNLLEQKYINEQVINNTEDIKLLQKSFQKFEEKRKINEIYFNGQIYDAYSKIQEIFDESKEQITIVDAYADHTILDIIKRLKVDVTIITKKDNLLTNQDILKYNKQYHNLNE